MKGPIHRSQVVNDRRYVAFKQFFGGNEERIRRG